MTKRVTTEIHPDWGCWIAYDSAASRPEDSAHIGEGKTRESAIEDYWAGVHGMDKTARLREPEWPEFTWALYDGKNIKYFDSREEAVQYGEAHEYLI